MTEALLVLACRGLTKLGRVTALRSVNLHRHRRMRGPLR
jgi:hypothetical protein